MQINLKQTEITDALKQYLSLKGIDLVNKSVDVSFTAGRKEGGLSAEINIDDQDIPGYTIGDEPVQLSLVASAEPMALPATDEAIAATEVAVTDAATEEAAAPKTTSLFS